MYHDVLGGFPYLSYCSWCFSDQFVLLPSIDPGITLHPIRDPSFDKPSAPPKHHLHPAASCRPLRPCQDLRAELDAERAVGPLGTAGGSLRKLLEFAVQ